MTTKQELMDYIRSLTPEQEQRMITRLALLKRCLTITDAQAIYTDTLICKLFGK